MKEKANKHTFNILAKPRIINTLRLDVEKRIISYAYAFYIVQ